MIGQSDLFNYPIVPGVKTNDATTLRAALDISARAPFLRAAVVRDLRDNGPASADQIAKRIGETILSIRPRCSELRADGQIVDTSERASNESGKMAIVWRLVSADGA